MVLESDKDAVGYKRPEKMYFSNEETCKRVGITEDELEKICKRHDIYRRKSDGKWRYSELIIRNIKRHHEQDQAAPPVSIKQRVKMVRMIKTQQRSIEKYLAKIERSVELIKLINSKVV